MTFDAREQSAQDASPVELYRFAHGSDVWTLTSGDEAFEYLGDVYQPFELKRSAPQQSNERGRSGVTVSMPKDAAVAALYLRFVPPRPVSLTIFVVHRGDAEIVDFWTGRVRAVEWAGVEARLTCEPNEAQLKRWGLRQLYQSACNLVLYGLRCGVPRSAFKTTTTVAAAIITTTTIKAAVYAAFDDGWFNGGYIERPDANGDARMIISHVGDTLVLLAGFEGLQGDERLFAYAGCAHDFATCSGAKFGAYTDDGEAFGGCPTIPTRNVHEQGLL